MTRKGRRRFLEGVGVAAVLGRGGEAEAQAPAKLSLEDAGERRQRLAAALRELNQAGGLGVSGEDLERAEAYASGAILEAEARLRPLVLPEGLDLPVVFKARRRP
jgi:hypothetical protein